MIFQKDSDAVLDYHVNWAPWLAAGETITNSSWVVPPGITKNTDTHDTNSTTVWLAGGTTGSAYLVTNRVTTNAGRTDDRSIQIRVVDK